MTIDIRPRRPNGPEPQHGEAGLILQAEVQWLLAAQPGVIDTVGGSLGPVAEKLTPELLLVDFGNAVGFFDVPILGRIEVVSGKWSEQHFDAMLRELTQVASALPFAAGTSSALPFDRSVAAREDVLYHAFVYLRHVLSERAIDAERLLPALNLVLREPHRRLERIRRDVPLERARYVDALALSKIAAGAGRPITLPPETVARLPLARLLRGQMPTRVEERFVRSTFDTPENRFVKTFIGQALGIIDGIRRVALRPPQTTVFRQRLLSDCDAMEFALRPIAHDPFWDGIGSMGHVPVASTVLHRRRGYREVFAHFSRLRLAARAPLDDRLVQRLLETKDIAELYELWCYFVIVGGVEGLLGRPIAADRPRADDLAVSVPRAFVVTWADGTRVSYNVTFSRSQSTGRRSYSVPLRPDIVLEVPQGPSPRLHMFDAKFKLDRVDGVLSTDADDSEEAEERRGTFKRGDLYKMHTYRDAIPNARSVWIVYPGDDVRFFSVAGETAVNARSLPNALDGVGAIPLTPDGSGATELRTILARLLTSE
ncbi:MAG: DUF2357 domain-containing protein [Chloroflexi bacterium]|nr:DUF2357 domain-containing protein [Chloroflexota bacterium]